MELDFNNPNPLIATLARLFADEGRTKEVAILAHTDAEIIHTGGFSGGPYYFNLILQIPYRLFCQLKPELDLLKSSISEQTELILKAYPNDVLQEVIITPLMSANDGWQDRAKTWLAGDGVSNQGRVRSDNIAPKECDGLLFRSQPEIYLYKALKKLGVTFAPLPVFLQGGENYRRIEPDFVIIKDGLIMVVEVDGDTVHHETPAEAHDRTTILLHEGAYLERVNASECSSPESAMKYAEKLLQLIAKKRGSSIHP